MRRFLITKAELLAGLIAGAATVFGSAVALLIVGLIPSSPLRLFFGVSYMHPIAGWMADAFFSPFWGRWMSRLDYGHGLPAQLQRWMTPYFGALLVFAAVVVLVGVGVRRRVESSPRGRVGTLVVAALTVGCVVAAAALLLAHTIPARETQSSFSPLRRMTFDPLTFFFGAFGLTLLLGLFTFGVVGLLRQPWRAVLRRAGVFVGICFAAFGLLFPAFVISDNLPTAHNVGDFVLASQFSAAAGGLSIPLALQAPVSLKQMAVTPWINYHGTGEATMAHWKNLATETMFSPQQRLFQYAASLGVAGSAVGAAISVIIAGALAFLCLGLLRSIGMRTVRRGLSLGLLQGVAITAVLAATAWLSSYYFFYAGNVTYWGLHLLGYAQAAATIIVICGLTGVIYGAVRARRERGLAAVGDAGSQAVAPGS